MSRSPAVVVVTGAGSGIGRATALAFLQAGHNVVLAGRRAELLNAVVTEAQADRRALAVPTDVTQQASVSALFALVGERFGRIDVLFNNAGTNVRNVLFEDLSLESWLGVVDVNLNGMFLCAQAAFRMMKNQAPQGGRIINNGSIAAHAPRPDSAPYTATKHAVTGLTKSISLDGRKYGIACGQIDIGNTSVGSPPRSSSELKQADGRMAIEPLMDVGQVAQAVLNMASLPLETNVQFMTIMPTRMPLVGRG